MNSTSFGKYLYAGQFIQKTGHVGHATIKIQDYPRRNQLHGPLIHRLRQTAKDQRKWMPGGVGRPHHQVG
jgi:hypothetical protein